MNSNAFIPFVIIVAVLAFVVFLNLKRRAEDRKDKSEGKQPRGIPKVIMAFWLLLVLAVISLLIWSPKK